MSGPTPEPHPPKLPRLELVIWTALIVVLLALAALTVLLVVKSGVLSPAPLDEEQQKSIWTFVGVAMGATVTLVGTLLAQQNHRRTQAQTAEAQAKANLADQQRVEREKSASEQHAQREAEEATRSRVETVAQMLPLLMHEGQYAKRGVIAGAVAAMMELEAVTVGVQVLRELLSEGGADAVSSRTALWLINRVLLEDSTRRRANDNDESQPDDRPEVYAAAELLALHAGTLLLPSDSQDPQTWVNWPRIFTDELGELRWPRELNSPTRSALLVFVIRLLMARDRNWWSGTGLSQPRDTLMLATWDEELGALAAAVLLILVEGDIVELESPDAGNVRTLAHSLEVEPWARRLLDNFAGWAGLDNYQATPLPTPRAASIEQNG